MVATKLDAAQVVAEREEVVLAPDRNSYSVKNMTAASGGTAIDVLRNIPLVEVDGSNNVSLRGNANVVIQINGRSTPLKGDQLGAFLAQLPAGTVKNVEVATNPSAKDDPEGTAGIINIVLNQEAELGLSGGVHAGTASTGQVNASGNVGKQQGKLTVFASGSVYRDHRDDVGHDLAHESRRFPCRPSPRRCSTARRRRSRAAATMRSEYRFTPRNIAVLRQLLLRRTLRRRQRVELYRSRRVARGDRRCSINSTSQLSKNLSQDYDLTFRRIDREECAALLDGARVRRTTRNTNDNDLSGNVLQAGRVDAGVDSRPSATTRSARYPYLNWKTDFTRQFGTTTKLETGFKATRRTTTNDFDAAYLDATTGVVRSGPTRATRASTTTRTSAPAMRCVSNKIGKLQTQAGLRLEDAATLSRSRRPSISGTTVAMRARIRARSSRTTSRDLRQAKISYSRRVSRPNPFQLSPIEIQPGHAQRLPRQPGPARRVHGCDRAAAIRSRGRGARSS